MTFFKVPLIWYSIALIWGSEVDFPFTDGRKWLFRWWRRSPCYAQTATLWLCNPKRRSCWDFDVCWSRCTRRSSTNLWPVSRLDFRPWHAPPSDDEARKGCLPEDLLSPEIPWQVCRRFVFPPFLGRFSFPSPFSAFYRCQKEKNSSSLGCADG